MKFFDELLVSGFQTRVFHNSELCAVKYFSWQPTRKRFPKTTVKFTSVRRFCQKCSRDLKVAKQVYDNLATQFSEDPVYLVEILCSDLNFLGSHNMLKILLTVGTKYHYPATTYGEGENYKTKVGPVFSALVPKYVAQWLLTWQSNVDLATVDTIFTPVDKETAASITYAQKFNGFGLDYYQKHLNSEGSRVHGVKEAYESVLRLHAVTGDPVKTFLVMTLIDENYSRGGGTLTYEKALHMAEIVYS